MESITNQPAAETFKPKKGDVFWYRLEDIEIEEGFNVRFDMGDIEGLAASILAQGMRQAGRGFTKPGSDKITLTDGHRRHAAVTLLHQRGHTDIRFKIEKEGRNPSEIDRVLGLISYNDGKGLTPIEEAEVYDRLVNKFGWSIAEVAAKVGRSHTHVDNVISLKTISPILRDLIIKGQVSATTIIEEMREAKGDAVKVETKVKNAIVENDGKKVTNKHLNPKAKAAKVNTDKVLYDTIIQQAADKTFTRDEIGLRPVGHTDSTVYVPYDNILAILRAAFPKWGGGN